MKQREVNFDILRTLIMFLIVLWHAMVHGMILDSNQSLLMQNDSFSGICYTFTIETLLYISSISVNCFILISGYFSVKHERKISKLVNLWFITIFYTLISFLLLVGTNSTDFKWTRLFSQLLPIKTGAYWFMTQYLGVILLSPYLNKMALSLTKKEYLSSLIILGFFSLVLIDKPFIFPYGNVYMHENRFIWFIFLYLQGAYIRLHVLNKSYHHYGKAFIICSFLFALLDISIKYFNQQFLETPPVFEVLRYNGFTFFLSLLIFMWAKNTTFKDNRFNRFLFKTAPYTLGIYLVHDSSFVRTKVWYDWLNLHEITNIFELTTVLIVLSVSIFMISLFIDFARSELFRLLHISDKITNIVNYSSSKLKTVFSKYFE